jgi:hypothetical protein
LRAILRSDTQRCKHEKSPAPKRRAKDSRPFHTRAVRVGVRGKIVF